VIRLRASRKLEEVFSSSLEGDELESAIASIPKRLDKFEGKWDQLLDWADKKYDPNSEENRRARASKELEEIFSSSLEGDELESAIASIPKRLDKFHGKWGELLEWAGDKYGYSDKKIINKESTNRKTQNQGSEGKMILGFTLAVPSILVLLFPTVYSISLLDARNLCASFVGVFAQEECQEVNIAFWLAISLTFLGLAMVYSSFQERNNQRSRPSRSNKGHTKFCSECGARFSDLAKFCSECGSTR